MVGGEGIPALIQPIQPIQPLVPGVSAGAGVAGARFLRVWIAGSLLWRRWRPGLGRGPPPGQAQRVTLIGLDPPTEQLAGQPAG